MKFGNTTGVGFTLGFAILHVITFVFDVVTLPIYGILQNPIGKRKKAKQKRAVVIAEDEQSITFSSIKKPSNFFTELVSENIDTMAKILAYCSKKYGDKRCLGTREILEEVDEKQPNGKVFKKYSMGNYKWRSYKQTDDEATIFGRGLREIGVHPGDNVVIFAETRAEWMVAAHGLFKQNITLVTIYATLGDDGIIHAINETEVSTVITSSELLPKFRNILLKTPRVQRIVYMDDQLNKFENPNKISNWVKFYTFNQVVSKGEGSDTVTISPTQDDIAIIMYTSGSTGVPKGVMLTHKNLIATVKGFCNSTDMKKDDVMLGFLPLAHVFELLVENVVIFMGIRIGYSTPLTMLDSSSKIKKGSKGDATVLRPSFLTSVPLIMDRIADGIKNKVSKGSFLVRLLFNFGYQYKVKWTKRGFSTPIVNRIIFGQVRQIVGGNVRLIIAGGAPLSPETHELVKTTVCTLLLQGYGLTESTSSVSVQDVYDDTYGRVGAPMTVLDMRLVNWEEGNYTVKDKPYPRGEIIVGGDNISLGYYKMLEKTNEDFFEENHRRWFKTGDIGEIHKDGVLKIIDRKKDIVKLQMGEYLSLGKIESLLKTHPLIENICIYADSTQTYCIGLIAPQKDCIIGIAEQKGIKKIFDDLCDDETVTKTVLMELTEYGKKVKLNKFEIPAAIKLVKEPWTAEMGFITTTFKLKRKEIQQFYKNDIKRLYSGAS